MNNKNKKNQKKNYFKGKNDLIVRKKLAKAFMLGLSDENACYFADIRLYELRKYAEKIPDFKERKKELQNRLQLAEKKGCEWIADLLRNPDIRSTSYGVENIEPEHLAKEYQLKLNDYILRKDETGEIILLEELKEIEKIVFETKSLETKELFIQSIPLSRGQRGYMLEIEKELEKEFDAQSVTEKSLCQMASMAFISYLHANYETVCYSHYEDHRHDQGKRNSYLIAISKEKNNAFRQYTAIIQTLKNLKTSPIKFNIVTKTLNMGQQQQINNTVKQ